MPVAPRIGEIFRNETELEGLKKERGNPRGVNRAGI
jgi:hypothetical protein